MEVIFKRYVENTRRLARLREAVRDAQDQLAEGNTVAAKKILELALEATQNTFRVQG